MFAVGGGMALLTDFSLSAMASNGRIGGGGTYYLISRSVGPQLGGAVGVMFYAANTIGMAFYLQGFTETMASLLQLDEAASSTYWIKFGIGTGVLAFETVINIVSSNLYARAALIVWIIQMGTIYYGNIALLARSPFDFTSLDDCAGIHGKVCHFTGPNMETLKSNLFPDWTDGNDLSKVFGIIFPAITGIMAGTNMSGVLRRPELAIPRGELGALAWTMGTYAVLVVSLGACVPHETLQNNKMILADVTWVPWLVTFGILTSTMSSTLASMQSAGRLLQAIALDGLVPPMRYALSLLSVTRCRFFGKTVHKEPVYAIIFSVCVAEGVMAIGSLDIIAPILTMFFLITYAATNFATFVHTVAGHPNFRPRFRFFGWYTAVIGFIACISLMIFLAWYASIIAVCIGVLIFIYITRNAPDTGWGEVSQSLIFHQVRKYLLQLDSRKDHPKFWRIQVLFLAHSPVGRANELEFVNNMKKGGLFVVGDTIVADQDDERRFDTLYEQRMKWIGFIHEADIKAFVSVAHGATLRHGVANLMTMSGLGGMRVNTLALDLYGESSDMVPLDDEQRLPFRDSICVETARRGQLREIRASAEWTRGTGERIASDDTDLPVYNKSGGWHIPLEEYVRIVTDTHRCGHNVLIFAGFKELDYSKIAQYKRPSWSAVMAPAPRSIERFTQPDVCSVDYWDVPWGTEESRSLALQLASMLQDADFWHAHTYLRVCSLIGSDDKGTAGPWALTDWPGMTHMRDCFGRLYQSIIRDSRIRATIAMFMLSEDSPGLYSEAVAMAESGDTEDPLDVALERDRTAACEVIHKFIVEQRQKSHTAVTFLPIPAFPDPSEAESWLADMKQTAAGIGPVVFVSGVQSVVCVDL